MQYFMAKLATPMMFGDVPHMKVFLMLKMETSGVQIHNRDIRDLQRGPAGSPGRCAASLKNLSGCKTAMIRILRNLEEKKRLNPSCSRLQKQRVIFTSKIRPWMVYPIGIPEHPHCT